MNKKKRRVAVLLSATIGSAVLVLSGCSGKSDQTEKTLRVGVITYTQDDPFINGLTDELKEQLKAMENKERRIIVSTKSGNDDQQEQNEKVEEMIDAGCDVLCINLVDRTAPSRIVRMARNEDIPVIFFNREPVKEDLMQLYGFLTRDELRVFRLLIGVSGIGPKGGLGILSALGPDDLRFAVASNDVKAIQAAPGIGKKTAEKLILELKDKLKLEDALENTVNAVQNTADTSAGMANEMTGEAVQALVALGYGNTEALKAVRQVEITEEMSVEDVLRQSLKYML
mgnify:CR=1 FL=1